jgi:hypothetical protein
VSPPPRRHGRHSWPHVARAPPPSLSFLSWAPLSSSYHEARARTRAPWCGRLPQVANKQRRRSAIAAGEPVPALHQLTRLVHLTRLAVGSTVVLTPRPDTSPMASSRRRWSSPLSGEWHVGPRVPLSATGYKFGWTAPGACSISRWVFENENRKWISRKCLNTSKIHILVKLASNLMRPILLGFLWLDLAVKNVASGFCDTFIYSFI